MNYRDILEFCVQNNIQLSEDAILNLNLYSKAFLEDNIDISFNQISSLFESIDISNINYRPLQEATTESSLNSLKKYGVTQTRPIRPVIKRTATQTVDVIKREGLNKNSKKKISTIFDNCMNELSSYFVIQPNSENSKFNKDKMKQALKLLIFTLIVSDLACAIISIICVLIKRPKASRPAAAILVAPIVEETAKEIASRKHIEPEFMTVFNALEFGEYTLGGAANILALKMNGKEPEERLRNVIQGRASAVGLHLGNQAIHHAGNTETKDKNEDKKKKKSLLAFVVTVLIHMIWNSLACFSPTFNDTISGIKRK